MKKSKVEEIRSYHSILTESLVIVLRLKKLIFDKFWERRTWRAKFHFLSKKYLVESFKKLYLQHVRVYHRSPRSNIRTDISLTYHSLYHKKLSNELTSSVSKFSDVSCPVKQCPPGWVKTFFKTIRASSAICNTF